MKLRKIYVILLTLICLMGFGLSFNKVEAAASSTLLVGSDTYNLVTSQEDIVSGKYIIAYESNYLGAYDNEIHTKVTSTSDALVLTFESTTNTNEFTISYDKDGTKTYLSYSGSGNKIQNITSGTATSAKFVVSYDSDTSLVKIKSVNVTSRYLQYNTQSPRFACYTVGLKNLNIYKLNSNCNHSNTTYVPAVDATCVENGNIAYTYCNDCKGYFEGNAITKAITQTDTVINALGHNFIEGVCSRCNEVIRLFEDVITAEDLAATSTSYKDFTQLKFTSSAIYAGRTSKNGTSMQFNSNNPIGIVSTASGGYVKKVVVEWDSASNNGTLDIYGSNTNYTDGSDLYAASTNGDKIGSITKGQSTELIVEGSYKYVGIRSYSGALKIAKITITWETPANMYFTSETPKASLLLEGSEESVTGMKVRFGGVMSALAFDPTATYGVLVLTSALENTSLTTTDIQGHITNKTALQCSPVQLADGSYQFAWVLTNTIAQENYAKPIYVYLYMIQNGNVYLTQCSTYTINGMIEKYIDSNEITLPTSVEDYLYGLYIG